MVFLLKKIIIATALILTFVILICIGIAVARANNLFDHTGDDSSFASGNASVVINEYVRADRADPSSELIKRTESPQIMPGFYEEKDLVPSFAVSPPSLDSEAPLLFWDSSRVDGAIDKIVTVQNVADYDAFVRTVFLAPVLLEFNTADAAWSFVRVDGTLSFDGGEYKIVVATYKKNNGSLPANTESEPCLLQVILSTDTTADDLEKYIDSEGKLKLFTVSQSVQAASLGTDPTAALDGTFGAIDIENNPWINKTE